MLLKCWRHSYKSFQMLFFFPTGLEHFTVHTVHVLERIFQALRENSVCISGRLLFSSSLLLCPGHLPLVCVQTLEFNCSRVTSPPPAMNPAQILHPCAATRNCVQAFQWGAAVYLVSLVLFLLLQDLRCYLILSICETMVQTLPMIWIFFNLVISVERSNPSSVIILPWWWMFKISKINFCSYPVLLRALFQVPGSAQETMWDAGDQIQVGCVLGKWLTSYTIALTSQNRFLH